MLKIAVLCLICAEEETEFGIHGSGDELDYNLKEIVFKYNSGTSK